MIHAFYIKKDIKKWNELLKQIQSSEAYVKRIAKLKKGGVFNQ